MAEAVGSGREVTRKYTNRLLLLNIPKCSPQLAPNLVSIDSDPSLCSGFQKSYPISSNIPAISDNACLFPVRLAASTPFSSICFASAVRPLRSSVCAAIK